MKKETEQQGKEFAEWLEENTTVIKEEKITLYRYCDSNNEWGNYILDDIYAEYLDKNGSQIFEGKELFEWVKASEELSPEDEIDIPLRITKDNGTKFYGLGHYEGDISMGYHTHEHAFFLEDEIEWLKPVKAKEQKGNVVDFAKWYMTIVANYENGDNKFKDYTAVYLAEYWKTNITKCNNDSDAVVLTKQELEDIKVNERGRGYEKGYADADSDNDFED